MTANGSWLVILKSVSPGLACVTSVPGAKSSGSNVMRSAEAEPGRYTSAAASTRTVIHGRIVVLPLTSLHRCVTLGGAGERYKERPSSSASAANDVGCGA